ncbi:DUF4269 domain-containing protein [Rhizobium sp. BR 315]|uniref:DUF4269 domain-containing protein n=1 Tax=Rhizobium sp. BR 315 TaxID=3040014 RepID=UPI003D33F061
MNTRAQYQDAIERVGIAHHLSAWRWALAGTPPLGIAVESSDIDIVCHAGDDKVFAEKLWHAFSDNEAFKLWQWTGAGRPVLSRFRAQGWVFEIFGSSVPIEDQRAMRHFEIERRLLDLGGARFRQAIIERRRAGQKTEPAFAALLGLGGNPYETMLEIGALTDKDLILLLGRSGFVGGMDQGLEQCQDD